MALSRVRVWIKLLNNCPHVTVLGSFCTPRTVKNADLGNGLPWYVGLGISTVLATIAATLSALSQQLPSEKMLPLYGAVMLSVLHSVVTSQAAPLMFRQRQYENDEAALTMIFNRFSRLHLFRTLFQVLTFASLLWALISYLR